MNATEKDVGRRVDYQPYPSATIEHGTITSVSDQFVFVRYDTQPKWQDGQATSPGDLTISEETT